MYILDTDHIGILQRQSGSDYQTLSRRIASYSQRDLFVTIVSFHEQILGWNAYIARARDRIGIVRGYNRLERILTDFSLAQVLSLFGHVEHVERAFGHVIDGRCGQSDLVAVEVIEQLAVAVVQAGAIRRQ